MVRRFINNANSNIKFSCSYGGKIILRHGLLRYLGGHTRLLTVPRSISYAELMVKLVEHSGHSIRLKCQLPNGDLETLVSITSDDDLAAIIHEYDVVSSPSLMKIRAILSPPNSIKYVSPPPSNSSSIVGNFFSPPPPVKYGYPKLENPIGKTPVSSPWNGYPKLGSPIGPTPPVSCHWNGYPKLGSPIGSTPPVSSHWNGYPKIASPAPVGSPGAMPAAPLYWHAYPHTRSPAAAMTAAAPHQHGYPQIGKSPAYCDRRGSHN